MADPHLPPAPGQPAADPVEGVPYKVLRRLGSGAHGTAFEAEQVALRRKVVIKLLHARYAGDEQVADRLRLEAQAVATLAPRTPHVVQILDFGHTGAGRAYIVMEHLEGRTLEAELAARGPLPPVEAVDIAVQILDGLAAAHDAGIIHRDVKPDNVFLCPSSSGGRTVKLLDFGLAKLARDLSGEGGPAPLVKPTEEGTIMGSPLYFSPEQASGNPATPRSDLYSAGVVLYHMLAGRPPFGAGDNLYVLVTAHLATPPPPLSAVAPQPIPDALNRAVQKALAKRPEDRHESAGAFRAALERAVRSAPGWAQTEKMNLTGLVPAVAPPRSTPEPSLAPRRRLSRLAALGAVAFSASLVVAAGAASVARWKLQPPRPVIATAQQIVESAPAPAPPPPVAAPPPIVTPAIATAEPAPSTTAPPPAPPPAEPPRGRTGPLHRTVVTSPPLGPPSPVPTASHRVFGSEN